MHQLILTFSFVILYIGVIQWHGKFSIFMYIFYSSGYQTGGRDPFEGRQFPEKGCQTMKLRFFKSILPNSSQIKALLCDILHLEGRRISKNKYGGRQPKKFENPCFIGLAPDQVKFDIEKSIFKFLSTFLFCSTTLPCFNVESIGSNFIEK